MLLLYIVTTSVPYICPQIQLIIKGPSMWRSIYISFGKEWPLELCEFFMFQCPFIMQTYSLRLRLDVDIEPLELNWVIIPNQSSIGNELQNQFCCLDAYDIGSWNLVTWQILIHVWMSYDGIGKCTCLLHRTSNPALTPLLLPSPTVAMPTTAWWS